ncbi:MAG TPA: PDZ domain-containing protein [Arenimonas sp.]
MKLRILSLLVAAAFAATAHASPETEAAEAARRAELESARAELQAAAKRVAELSRGEHRSRIVEVERIRRDGNRARLGIVMGAEPGVAGVRIAAVTPEGPAAKAGLRSGDQLESIDGKAISAKGDAAVDQARKLLGKLEMDQKVRLGYRRDGKPATATVTAGDAARVMMFTSGDDFQFHFGEEFEKAMELRELAQLRAQPLIHPGIEMEIARIAAAPCAPGDDDCKPTVLAQAFRWNGLNLASVDAKLGRYFGTDRGVLVLGGGQGLEELEPGDVIQRIGATEVSTPREAMRALRDQDAGDKLQVQLLRDRKSRTVQVTVPEAPTMKWFAPPAPPAPPTPPAPPSPPTPRGAPTPPTPPAPPAPPANDTAVVFADGVVTRIAARGQRVD